MTILFYTIVRSRQISFCISRCFSYIHPSLSHLWAKPASVLSSPSPDVLWKRDRSLANVEKHLYALEGVD